MSDNAKTTASAGFPTCTALTILFVLLKVFGKITWSWWLVFAPLWLPLVAVLGILGITLLIGIIAALFVG